MYFDRKAKASPLNKGDYCFLLNPKITKQNDRLAIGECKWTGLYKIEKCLTHSNYLIRKVNTCFTQVVHRIRLRKYTPPNKPVDIIIDRDTKFETDMEFPETLEPNLMDSDKVYDSEPGTQLEQKSEDSNYTRNDLENSISIRYPFSDRGRSEYNYNLKEKERNDQTPEENIEWWRRMDREKEALNLETNRYWHPKTQKIAKNIKLTRDQRTERTHRIHEFDETSSESEQEVVEPGENNVRTPDSEETTEAKKRPTNNENMKDETYKTTLGQVETQTEKPNPRDESIDKNVNNGNIEKEQNITQGGDYDETPTQKKQETEISQIPEDARKSPNASNPRTITDDNNIIPATPTTNRPTTDQTKITRTQSTIKLNLPKIFPKGGSTKNIHKSRQTK